MRVFDMIVEERRHMADLLESLTPEQLRQPSLCDGWTMHDVGAHLVTYLRFGQAKLYFGIFTMGADFDRLNVVLTRRAARRTDQEIIALLRRRAGARTTIPRSGYDPVLADLVLHDLDVRLPLGIARQTPVDRVWVAFHHLATRPSPGFGVGSRLDGLRLVATDTGWSLGSGAPVEGRAEDLLLAMGGRPAGVGNLSGEGAAILRERFASPPRRRGLLQRLAIPLRVLLNPAPPERRSRTAVDPVPPRSG